MMQDYIVYAWLIKGLGGLVALLEAMTIDGCTLADHWYIELRKFTERLNEVVKKQGKNR